MDPISGIALGFIALIFFLGIIGLLLTVFWVWMLVDCANASMPSGDKTAWILIILFTHILGAVLYYFIPRRERLSLARQITAIPPTGFER